MDGVLREVTLMALQGTWHILSDHHYCWSRAGGTSPVRGQGPSPRASNAKPKMAQGAGPGFRGSAEAASGAGLRRGRAIN